LLIFINVIPYAGFLNLVSYELKWIKMNILIAEERKNIIDSIKLLLENEVGQTNCISAVLDKNCLKIADSPYKPDILILDGEFLNKRTIDTVFSFKKYCPEMFIVLIDRDHENKKRLAKMNIDLFINKKSSSAKELDSLIDLVKKKID
jgi:DNA-binding NarL/FixJ family response regulator